jgi:biopolymer transport protein ExbD
MTPMIDVTFLLIIFFLVSSHLSKQENHVKLNLPEAKNAAAADLLAAQTVTTINLLDDGSLRIGSADVLADEVVGILSAKNTDVGGKLQVRIRCSHEQPFSRVSPILAACARSEITDIVFAVYQAKATQ